MTDDVAKQYARRNTKDTLLWVYFPLECIKGCKGAFQVVNKGMCFLGFDNYIINISLDKVVDSTAGCKLLSFLDCYAGYHQIALKKDDQIKTSFIMPFGAYCYTTMSFGLKNAGATYQRAN